MIQSLLYSIVGVIPFNAVIFIVIILQKEIERPADITEKSDSPNEVITETENKDDQDIHVSQDFSKIDVGPEYSADDIQPLQSTSDCINSGDEVGDDDDDNLDNIEVKDESQIQNSSSNEDKDQDIVDENQTKNSTIKRLKLKRKQQLDESQESPHQVKVIKY